jgi:serine/threonine-protein kinase
MALTATWLSTQFPELVALTPLSSGGQKLVFAASHQTEGEVVLKVIRPPVDLEEVAREILAVQRVNSGRVPRILAHGQLVSQLGNCFWFREPRVSGQTVRERLTHSALPPRLLLRLGLQMLEALVAAEDVHIVHRDVKPENIMCDAHEQFWLLDFGVARHLQLSSKTPTEARFGKYTPGYGPPEQFRNIKPEIDARSDLFALGVTLYECATGSNPFRDGAPNVLDILQRVETTPLPPLDLPFDADHQFSQLVAAMSQRRRDHRPRSAREALDWMREICQNRGE